MSNLWNAITQGSYTYFINKFKGFSRIKFFKHIIQTSSIKNNYVKSIVYLIQDLHKEFKYKFF